jgi:hypothetical protein
MIRMSSRICSGVLGRPRFRFFGLGFFSARIQSRTWTVRHQLPDDLAAEVLGKLDQAIPLFRGNDDAFWQARPQNLVLDLQVFDLAGQFFLRGAGDHKQK